MYQKQPLQTQCGQWMPESILKKFEKAWFCPAIFHTNLPSANQFE